MTVVPTQLQAGDEIPLFERTTDLDHWNRYAAVNDEFVGLHMDDEVGRAAGYPGAIGMGHLMWAYVINLLESWLGDDGRVVRVRCQFRGPNLRGTVARARGVVREVHADGAETRVELDVWVEDGDGTRTVPGDATVAVFNG